MSRQAWFNNKNPRRYKDEQIEALIHEFRRVQYQLVTMPKHLVGSDQGAVGHIVKEAKNGTGPFRQLGVIDEEEWKKENARRMLVDEKKRIKERTEEIDEELAK